jgi:hypothetical protein
MAGVKAPEGPVPSNEGDSAKPSTSIAAHCPTFLRTFLRARFMSWLRSNDEVHPSSTTAERSHNTGIDTGIAINPDTRLRLTQEQRRHLYNVLPRTFEELVESEDATELIELVGLVLHNRYHLMELVSARKGRRSIFTVLDLDSSNRPYFMKMERLETAQSAERKDEISVQSTLVDRIHQMGPELNIGPELQYAFNTLDWELEGRHCILMEPFGPSLDVLWKYCHRRFTMETCLYITIELLAGYKHLHQAGFLHNAMNLDAYSIGGRPGNKGHVYIADYGSTRMYTQHPRSRPRQVDPRWSSIWADCNLAEEPRSEIMSLALMMIFLLGGDNQVPWRSPGLRWIDEHFDPYQYRQAKASWIRNVARGHRTKELAPFEGMIAYCVNDVGQGQCADCDELITRLKRYAKHHRLELGDILDWEEHIGEHWTGRIAIKSLDWIVEM